MTEVAVYYDATSGGWKRWGDHKWVTYNASLEWLTDRRNQIAQELAEFDAVLRVKAREDPSGFTGLRVVK